MTSSSILIQSFCIIVTLGKASDAVKCLRNYQMQIRRWLNIVEETMKRGESAEAIRDTVLREDETIREIVPNLKANPVHCKTLIENSVQGFIDFAEEPLFDSRSQLFYIQLLLFV